MTATQLMPYNTRLGILLVLGRAALCTVLTSIVQSQLQEFRTIPAVLLTKKKRCGLEPLRAGVTCIGAGYVVRARQFLRLCDAL